MKKIDESDPHFEKARSLGQSIAKRLDKKLGRPATLQDYIVDFITQTTYKEIEKKFWGLVTIWETTGRNISDAKEVYNKLFKEDKKTIEYIEYGNIDFLPKTNKTYEDQLDELHLLSNCNDEVPVKNINSNEEAKNVNSNKPPEKKKELGDYLVYIWGAAALLFLLIGIVTKHPYITAIIIVVIVLNLLNKKS